MTGAGRALTIDSRRGDPRGPFVHHLATWRRFVDMVRPRRVHEFGPRFWWLIGELTSRGSPSRTRCSRDVPSRLLGSRPMEPVANCVLVLVADLMVGEEGLVGDVRASAVKDPALSCPVTGRAARVVGGIEYEDA